ncbi:hypothetical protein FBQ81_01175 [Chloroflexi bacterium CFX6]|nr:hypothetical protein [Chloroflexi bacterium CFX6]
MKLQENLHPEKQSWIKIILTSLLNRCEIHNNYKTTFQEYTKLAIENDGDSDLIIEKIRQDSIYSEDLRNELKNMVNSTPSAFPKTSDQLLDEFLTALSYYFELRALFKVNQENGNIQKIYAPRMSNAARYRVVVILSRKGMNSNKAEVIKVLQETMRMLQSNYEWVSKSFYRLRKGLLN